MQVSEDNPLYESHHSQISPTGSPRQQYGVAEALAREGAAGAGAGVASNVPFRRPGGRQGLLDTQDSQVSP